MPAPNVVAPVAPVSSRRKEAPLILLAATALFFLVLGHERLVAGQESLLGAVMFGWLFAVIVVGSAAVVRHADCLAALLGEPYGTLILTLSVASIEIMTIGIVMTTGEPDPTLARDTMFSVVMIVLNGLIGLALLLGGMRFKEQEYNLRGVNAYLSVIVALSVFGLIVPNMTTSTPGPTFSRGQEGFLIVMCLGLYAVFLAIQTTRHRAFFLHPQQDIRGTADPDAGHHAPPGLRSTRYHVVLLVIHLALVIFLAEKLAILLDHGIDVLGAPPALGALAVAVLVLAPEGMGAIAAARSNDMQRSVNILLGSVLATLALTIPAVVIIGLFQGTTVVLGLARVEEAMLLLTLLISMLTFASGRTNVLQGAVHMMLFLAYLMLIIWR
ncbi:MAG: calcium:proton antiporter [Betaproteobacteria bacterium]